MRPLALKRPGDKGYLANDGRHSTASTSLKARDHPVVNVKERELAIEVGEIMQRQ